MKLLFLDSETTGNLEEDRLIQLAWKTSEGAVVNETFKPPLPIKYGAMAVHHITNEDVETKNSFQSSTSKLELEKLLEDHFIVAHNAEFDVEMLRKEGVKIEKYIDTLKLARKYVEAETHQLQALRYQLKLGSSEDLRKAIAHDALGDVLILEQLFLFLEKLIDPEKKDEILLASCEPSLIEIMQFGKHKGRKFEDVAIYHRDYLEWLDAQPGDKNRDLKFTLNHYLRQSRKT